MLETFCEIVISICAVYGGYTILCQMRNFIFRVIEKRNHHE